MVPMRDLDDDYYEFDEKNYCLVGRRKKHVYQLGDKLTVRVARADLVKKQLDFALVDSKKPEVNVDKNGNLVKPQDSASKGAKKTKKKKK